MSFIICGENKTLSPISALFYTFFSPGSTHHPCFLTTSLLNQNILNVVVGINRTKLKCYGLWLFCSSLSLIWKNYYGTMQITKIWCHWGNICLFLKILLGVLCICRTAQTETRVLSSWFLANHKTDIACLWCYL